MATQTEGLTERLACAAVQAYLEIDYLQFRLSGYGRRRNAYERDMGAVMDREIARLQLVLDGFQQRCECLGLDHDKCFDSAMRRHGVRMSMAWAEPIRQRLAQLFHAERQRPEIDRQRDEEARKRREELLELEKERRERAKKAREPVRESLRLKALGIKPPRKRKRRSWIRSKRELKELLKLDPTRWEPTGYAIKLAHWPECDLDIEDDAISEAIREYTGREPVPEAL